MLLQRSVTRVTQLSLKQIICCLLKVQQNTILGTFSKTFLKSAKMHQNLSESKILRAAEEMRFLGNNLCWKQEADRGEQLASRAPKESNGGGDKGLV